MREIRFILLNHYRAILRHKTLHYGPADEVCYCADAEDNHITRRSSGEAKRLHRLTNNFTTLCYYRIRIVFRLKDLVDLDAESLFQAG